MHSLTRRTKAYIISKRLIERGQRVLVAVSGGRDSLSLLYILAELQTPLGFTCAAANFNHKLRPEADEEAVYIAACARRLGVDYYGGSADINALSAGRNLQDTARQYRYAFLRRVAAEHDYQLIATAHHADDQAETLLLHLLRGAGSGGLGGMPPKTDDVIRPLLFAAQADIAAYIADNNLEYRQDVTNFSTKYMRNKIRWELLPALKEYNPNIVAALNAAADICRDEDELLTSLAAEALPAVWDAQAQTLEARAFAALPAALRRRVLRLAYQQYAAADKEPSFEQVQAALELKRGQALSLPDDVMLSYRGQQLIFSRFERAARGKDNID
ncbi:MAG: tRNA lysidine(34) synthetase TilS [Bacillota bacterium]|nr:tRNA lysidine(34) synthetase TilS [Bacillota bacterium]